MVDKVSFTEKINNKLKTNNVDFVWINECLIIISHEGKCSMPMRLMADLLTGAPKKFIVAIKERSNARVFMVVGLQKNIDELKNNDEFKALCIKNWKWFIDDCAISGYGDAYHGYKGKFDALPENVKSWLLTGEHGISSEVLFSKTIGMRLGICLNNGAGCPDGIDEFGRCVDLIKAIPEINIDEMKGINEKWDFVIENWALLNTYLKCYRFLNESYKDAPRDLFGIVAALKTE